MSHLLANNFRHRSSYGKHQNVLEVGNLIEIQRKSYDLFLQRDVAPEDRENIGLQSVFKSVFPIEAFAGSEGDDKKPSPASLQFVSYELEKPKHDAEECRERGMTFSTYSAPIKVTVRLVVWDIDKDTNERRVSNIKEHAVYFGEIPLMTENGTFIINGTERVIVSQLHRSPGVFFDSQKSKTGGSKDMFSARIIPNRGSWIDFEFDTKDILYVRIDRRRKLPATVLLRSLAYDTEALLNHFYESERFFFEQSVSAAAKAALGTDKDIAWFKETTTGLLLKQRATVDIRARGENTPVIVKADKKFLQPQIRKMRDAGLLRYGKGMVEGKERDVEFATIRVRDDELIGKVSAHDIVHPESGRIIVSCNEEFTVESVQAIMDAGITGVDALFIDNLLVGSFVRDTLLFDSANARKEAAVRHAEEDRAAEKAKRDHKPVPQVHSLDWWTDLLVSKDAAIVDIYRRLRSGDPPTMDTAQKHFDNLFFKPERYDLSRVGRHKLNHKLGLNFDLDQTTLTREDILKVVKYLIDLKNNKGDVDDIDHLGNRRVRGVGELLENQYRVGLERMAKAIKERMSLSEIDALMPNELINSKPVSAVVKEFFGSSQLSQFMDQTNPLSEITHKRRLSALGPGGLTRERAGFDVRDVHPTHYGRICPIETPEGPNIGLIASLATYARVNEFGFIETPYRVMTEGRVTNEVQYFDALEEEHISEEQAAAEAEIAASEGTEAVEHHIIAQTSSKFDAKGYMTDELIAARGEGGEFVMVNPKDCTLMDVASNQLVSVAAALVPFLENDDANRALMGANMQRQAVPVVRTEAPLVGTGMERIVARDSGVTVTARRDGTVESVDASRIVVKTDAADASEIGADVDIYNLTKFMRSNQSTCINQKPVVRPGDRVRNGDVIADGPATELGELALGQNVVVAFMPWGGYNFEDSILISERLVADDMYTTIHIEEFELSARDTKLGKEEVTRDIPNVGDEALRNLDESGIVRIGAEVVAGDILVGRITPKGETQLSPEEKLLRAIFGEKAGDVRDTSLRVPPGVEGTVIGAQVFSREGVEKDSRALEIEAQAKTRIERDRLDTRRTIKESALRQLYRLLKGHKAAAAVVDPNTGETIVGANQDFTFDALREVPENQYDRIAVADHTVEQQVWQISDQRQKKLHEIDKRYEEKMNRLQKGDDLPPGVIRMVKIYVAIKRKLSVGDKMAGRHGNKGVISKILPIEDLPYLEDGTPVDIVLNPLGVPSRMNVGQILEIHLGWAARGMGRQIQHILEEDYSADSLREYLRKVFKRDKEALAFVEEANEDELKTYAAKYKKGVTVGTPVFSGATEEEIKDALVLGGQDRDGQTLLFDGRTGESFHMRVTVGVMYMLKLHHLVDDKIHARSIGPYSLVTQQPLGGKAQFGGQRLGEMEVWAMEAYGAAYGLQEFLTVKSDDVAGRTRMYESIVKGENVLEAGLPESFNVLVKEMQALALDVDLIEEKDRLL